MFSPPNRKCSSVITNRFKIIMKLRDFEEQCALIVGKWYIALSLSETILNLEYIFKYSNNHLERHCKNNIFLKRIL